MDLGFNDNPKKKESKINLGLLFDSIKYPVDITMYHIVVVDSEHLLTGIEHTAEEQCGNHSGSISTKSRRHCKTRSSNTNTAEINR